MIDIFFVFLRRTINCHVTSCRSVTTCFLMTRQGSLRRAKYGLDKEDKLIYGGRGGIQKLSVHIKAFTNAVFETHWNLATSQSISLERSNGGCPGFDYIIP